MDSSAPALFASRLTSQEVDELRQEVRQRLEDHLSAAECQLERVNEVEQLRFRPDEPSGHFLDCQGSVKTLSQVIDYFEESDYDAVLRFLRLQQICVGLEMRRTKSPVIYFSLTKEAEELEDLMHQVELLSQQ